MVEKIDVRTLPPKTQETLRFIAIRAIEDGKTQAEAAKLVGFRGLLSLTGGSLTRRAISDEF